MSIKEFSLKHPIIFNAVAIAATSVLLCVLALVAMNIFTEHGRTRQVPDVQRMTISEAKSAIEACGFKCEISDSVYNESYKPGTVIDQEPKALSQVKSKRTIYIVVNPLCPRTSTMPSVKEMSVRQGRSVLEGLGFRNIDVQEIPSEYDGLILSVSVDGREVEPGTKVMLTSKIILSVGSGVAAQDTVASENATIIDGGASTLMDPSLI